MNEKQYKLVIDEDTGAENILDVIGNKEYNLIEDIVDVLNELATKCSYLEKENEQLKEEIKDLKDILARYEEKELKE